MQAKIFASLSTVLIALAAFFYSPSYTLAQSQDVSGDRKKILVVLGYVDSGSPKNLEDVFEGKFNFPLARELNTRLMREIMPFSRKVETIDYLKVYQLKNADISVLSVNELCNSDEESNIEARRVQPCDKQIRRSLWAGQFLRQYARRYHSVIYLGHARGGQGLALGPPVPEHTLSVIELGWIQRLVMAACDSVENFSWQLSNVTRDFRGTLTNEDTGLLAMIPIVLSEIKPYLERFEGPQNIK